MVSLSIGTKGCPHDVDLRSLGRTGIRLSDLKVRFDRTLSRRVVMMLDSCHSGGVIARGVGPHESLERAIKFISGEGRVILAACTVDQSAMERAGHGDFTRAVLSGLQGGAATPQGHVTINSLFDHVSHSIPGPDQEPMFYGSLKGSLVLSYTQPRRAEVDATVAFPKASAAVVTDSSPWMLLGDQFVEVRAVEESENDLNVQCVAPSPGVDGFLKGLTKGHHRPQLPFAYGTSAGAVVVRAARSMTDASGQKTWQLELQVAPGPDFSTEMATSNYSADDLAELRAKRLLTGEPMVKSSRAQSFDMVEMFIAGMGDGPKVTQCIFPELRNALGSDSSLLAKARLGAMQRLVATGCVGEIVELRLGPIEGDTMADLHHPVRRYPQHHC